MMMVMMADAMPLFAVLPVFVGVYHQQHENDHATNEQNDQIRPALPQLTNKIQKGRVHPALTYTR